MAEVPQPVTTIHRRTPPTAVRRARKHVASSENRFFKDRASLSVSYFATSPSFIYFGN